MQSISQALERLYDEAGWFVRAREVRLLVVQVSGDLRASALKVLSGLEFHADNESPWLVLEDGREAVDDGWVARAIRLVASWEERREAFLREEGIEQGTVPRPKVPEGSQVRPARVSWLDRLVRRQSQVPRGPSDNVEVFGRSLEALCRAVRPPLSGLVVVLAPTVLEAPEVFEAELEVLLGASSLESCRFVLVLDGELPLPRRLIDGLGERALVCDCQVDPALLDQDLAALLSCSGPDGQASGGGAGPLGVSPPRRVDDPPELPREQRDALLREAGVEPALLDEGPRLGPLVLGAALAMKAGRGPEAVKLQREARDLAGRLGLTETKVACQLGLASYLAGLGRRDLALDELLSASRLARTAGLGREQSQVLLAQGLLRVLDRKLPEAAHDYALSARTAEAAGEPLLAIEGYRMAGQLAEQLGARRQAVTCFREALRVAEGADVELVQQSSAAEVARRLSEVLEKERQASQAQVLGERAERIERGQYGLGAGPMTEAMAAMDFDGPSAQESTPLVRQPTAEPAPGLSPVKRTLELELLEELTVRTRELPAFRLPGEPEQPPVDDSPRNATVPLPVSPPALALPRAYPPTFRLPLAQEPRTLEFDAVVLPGESRAGSAPATQGMAKTVELDALGGWPEHTLALKVVEDPNEPTGYRWQPRGGRGKE